MSEAFLYKWENIRTGKKYIGVHKGDPGDGYIASSKTFLQDYMAMPYMFERKIVSKGSFKEMLKEEALICKTYDVKNNEEYYNQHNGDGNFYCDRWPMKSRLKVTGRKKPEHAAKMKAKWADPGFRERQIEGRKNHDYSNNGNYKGMPARNKGRTWTWHKKEKI